MASLRLGGRRGAGATRESGGAGTAVLSAVVDAAGLCESAAESSLSNVRLSTKGVAELPVLLLASAGGVKKLIG